MSKKMKNNNIDYIDVLLFTLPFFTGLLSLWSLALFAILCLGGIIYQVVKNKKIKIPIGKNVMLLLIYLFSFLVVEIYAVDKGMNLLAFFKNFTIFLFLVLYMNIKNANKEERSYERYKTIPYSACFTLLFSFLMMLVPNNQYYFNSRLQGVFHYANSYGLFLLIGCFILFEKKEYTWKDYVVFFILFLGIILTNSRAIIILTFLTMLISLFYSKEERKRHIIILICFVLLFTGIYLFSKIEKRVNQDMVNSSEFVTRLLYYSDAVQMIKDKPFGYGFEGWYYKQAELQTGVYDTKYVHNSILQVLLDVGGIPTIALFILLVFTFFNKKQNFFSRMIMILILGHSLIDIDLEYLYFIVILATFMVFESKEMKINKSYSLVITLLSLLGLWYGLVFISDVLYESKEYQGAISVIPFHTEAMQEILYSSTDKETQLEFANKVLKLNQNVSGAYEAISNELASKNEYLEAIEIEEKRLKLNRYTMYNYLTYAQLLSDGIQYYGKNKQIEEQKVLLQKVIDIEAKIQDVIANTNPLCYKTIHTPNLEIPEELQSFIDKAKKAMSK